MTLDFFFLLPEIFLLFTFIGLLISESGYFFSANRLTTPISLIGFTAAFFQTLVLTRYETVTVLSGTFVVDPLSLFMKALFITLGFLTISLTTFSKKLPEKNWTELNAFVVTGVLALCLVCQANDLITLFVSMIFLCVVGSLVALFFGHDEKKLEASVKYLISAAFSIIFLGYAFAAIFGITGELDLTDIHEKLQGLGASAHWTQLAIVLLLGSISFFIWAFPKNLWIPDYLQGVPASISAFLAVGFRSAAILVLIRLLIGVFSTYQIDVQGWVPIPGFEWQNILGIISGASMLIGSILAYRQVSIKRLIAYLVLADTGYLLLGVLVMDQIGISAIIFQMFLELWVLSGIYFVVGMFVESQDNDSLSSFSGYLKRFPLDSIVLILLLFTFVGLPPLPGFFGRYMLVGSAFEHGWTFLAVIGLVATLFAVFSVARVAAAFFGSPIGEPFSFSTNKNRSLVVALLTLPLLVVTLLPDSLLELAKESIKGVIY